MDDSHKVSLQESSEETSLLLKKVQQLKELRQVGLLSSVSTQESQFKPNMQQSTSAMSLLTNIAATYHNGGHPQIPQQRPPQTQNLSSANVPGFSSVTGSTGSSPLTQTADTGQLPVTTWTSGDDAYFFGCVPKYWLTNFQQMQQNNVSQMSKLSVPAQQPSASLATSTNGNKRKRLHHQQHIENQTKKPKSSLSVSSPMLSKQKRTKWTGDDLFVLWRSISEHGNEWQKVKRSLTGRTYHQVKDKGKRLLHEHGWQTGRSKVQNDLACERAKTIAMKVLASLNIKAQ